MLEVWKMTIPELSGEEERRAYVYIPNSIRKEPDRRYPVLYMFDGHNVFYDSHATYGTSWGMKRYMDRSKTQMIIAAVECTHDPDNGRLSEYSPFDFESGGFGKVKGRGRETMEWMVNCFKPFVDENFPTLPQRENTFIAGSSMGGLMSVYALLEYNEVFSRAAALSPSLWVARGAMERMIAGASVAPDTVLYMDYGQRELGNHRGMRGKFSRATARLMDKGVLVDSRIVPAGEHCEASWERQIPFFMNTLLYHFD